MSKNAVANIRFDISEESQQRQVSEDLHSLVCDVVDLL